MTGAFEIDHMYKLPRPEPIELIQQDFNVPNELNANGN